MQLTTMEQGVRSSWRSSGSVDMRQAEFSDYAQISTLLSRLCPRREELRRVAEFVDRQSRLQGRGWALANWLGAGDRRPAVVGFLGIFPCVMNSKGDRSLRPLVTPG